MRDTCLWEYSEVVEERENGQGRYGGRGVFG